MENNVITIASLNVRGFGNDTIRKETFNWLRSKHFSIYLLQEVHCSEKEKQKIYGPQNGAINAFLRPCKVLRQV